MENQQTNQQQIQEEQPNWMEQELKEIEQNKPTGEFPEALQLEEGKVTEFEVVFDKEFEKWIDANTGMVKKIIPVKHGGADKVLWMNVANPLYKDIIELGMKGQKVFKVMRTGQAKATRYNLVKN